MTCSMQEETEISGKTINYIVQQRAVKPYLSLPRSNKQEDRKTVDDLRSTRPVASKREGNCSQGAPQRGGGGGNNATSRH